MNQKQVDKEHYSFSKYVNKKRWLSVWHQLDEVLSLNPSSVLEIGPGAGLFKALITHFGISVETVDLDSNLKPDYVASATDLPFAGNTYDCVCAFQMLEHLPYEKSLQAFKEMVRVGKKYVVISLPDAKTIWPYTLHIPKFGQKIIHIPKPRLRNEIHQFDGQHYWEINKRDYPLKKITDDYSLDNVQLNQTYRVKENPYYRFFVFKKFNVD